MPLLVGLACSVVATAQTPVVSAVLNAASYSDGPVSPGAIVVVFGHNLGPAELVQLRLTAEGKVSTELSGVRVEFDGAPAPIIYVSKFQLSAVVPYSVAGRAATEIRIQTGAGMSQSYAKLVAPSGPGLFTGNASGAGQGAIVNADGSLNGSGFPAAKGSAVSLFLTGVGLTEPAFSDGVLASGIAWAVLPVSVSIGGMEATVLYAGAAPGTVSGFAQVNITIPNGLQYGGDLPLEVRIGEGVSQADVTIAVEGLAKPPAAPPAPTLTANPLSAASIRLLWMSQAESATGFELERRILPSGAFALVAQPNAQVRSHDDFGLLSGTGYEYRMRVITVAGPSPYSSPVSASTLLAPPAPPSELQARSISTTEVELSWRNNSADVSAVWVEFESSGVQPVFGHRAGGRPHCGTDR